MASRGLLWTDVSPAAVPCQRLPGWSTASPLPPSILSPPTSPFLVPAASGVSVMGTGCGGISAPSSPPQASPPQRCRTGTHRSTEHPARPGWCRAASGGGRAAGPSSRVPRWRSKPQEQRDASRTEQAQAASAPLAAAPRDVAARQHSDHPSINGQSCAPSLVLAKEGTSGAAELSRAGARSRLGAESSGCALAQPGAAPTASLGGWLRALFLSPWQSPHSLSTCHVLRPRASSSEVSRLCWAPRPHPLPMGRGCQGPSPAPSHHDLHTLPPLARQTQPGLWSLWFLPAVLLHHPTAPALQDLPHPWGTRLGWPRGFRRRSRACLVWERGWALPEDRQVRTQRTDQPRSSHNLLTLPFCPPFLRSSLLLRLRVPPSPCNVPDPLLHPNQLPSPGCPSLPESPLVGLRRGFLLPFPYPPAEEL